MVPGEDPQPLPSLKFITQYSLGSSDTFFQYLTACYNQTWEILSVNVQALRACLGPQKFTSSIGTLEEARATSPWVLKTHETLRVPLGYKHRHTDHPVNDIGHTGTTGVYWNVLTYYRTICRPSLYEPLFLIWSLSGCWSPLSRPTVPMFTSKGMVLPPLNHHLSRFKFLPYKWRHSLASAT